jgi:hypothetical protein
MAKRDNGKVLKQKKTEKKPLHVIKEEEKNKAHQELQELHAKKAGRVSTQRVRAGQAIILPEKADALLKAHSASSNTKQKKNKKAARSKEVTRIHKEKRAYKKMVKFGIEATSISDVKEVFDTKYTPSPFDYYIVKGVGMVNPVLFYKSLSSRAYDDWREYKYIHSYVVRPSSYSYKDLVDTVRRYDTASKARDFMDETTLWHGTDVSCIKGILKSNFHCGESGMLGGGIYLTPDIGKVWTYNYSLNNTRYILEVKARLGRVINAGDLPSSDYTYGKQTRICVWDKGFHSVYAGPEIPRYSNMKYREYCVYHSEQVTLTKIHVFKSQGV